MFNEPMYKERYYWSLKDILNSSKEDYQLDNTDIITLVSAMTSYSTPVLIGTPLTWASPYYTILMDLIIKRFHSHFAVITESDTLENNDKYNFIAKLLYVLEMTSPRFLKLLTLYSSEDNKLLDKIASSGTSISRFNDTPQNGGDWSADGYTTNITQGSSSSQTDGDTKMGRLAEIQREYRNLLLDWSNEFEALFIEEDNL